REVASPKGTDLFSCKLHVDQKCYKVFVYRCGAMNGPGRRPLCKYQIFQRNNQAVKETHQSRSARHRGVCTKVWQEKYTICRHVSFLPHIKFVLKTCYFR